MNFMNLKITIDEQFWRLIAYCEKQDRTAASTMKAVRRKISKNKKQLKTNFQKNNYSAVLSVTFRMLGATSTSEISILFFRDDE